MPNKKDSLEKIIKKIQEEDDIPSFKKWNEDLISKFILLFPSIIFLITFLRINNDKSINDLFNFLVVSSILVLLGLGFNFLLTKK
tara:strand:+ start:2153 stop:2407 length:255 start_codon:yes stop_codon:yes gene_type:complete